MIYMKSGVIQEVKSDVFSQTKFIYKPVKIWLEEKIQNLTQQKIILISLILHYCSSCKIQFKLPFFQKDSEDLYKQIN